MLLSTSIGYDIQTSSLEIIGIYHQIDGYSLNGVRIQKLAWINFSKSPLPLTAKAGASISDMDVSRLEKQPRLAPFTEIKWQIDFVIPNPTLIALKSGLQNYRLINYNRGSSTWTLILCFEIRQ